MSELFPTLRRAVRSFGRGLKKLGRALLYILALLLVIHIGATLITGYLLRRELARLRRAGEPLTVAELIPRLPPGEKNAADIYQQAFRARRVSEAEEELLWGGEAGWSAQRLAVARRVVAANADYFALLEKASRTPHCVFPVRWESGAGATFPHLARLRESARMLGARAVLLAQEKRADEAIANCATMLRIAEHAKGEPSLISQFVGYAVQGMAMESLEQVLSRSAPSRDGRRELFDQIGGIDQIRPSLRCLQGERTLFGLWIFDFYRRYSTRVARREFGLESGEARRLLFYTTLGRPLLNLDEISYLEAMQAYLEASPLPWPEAKKQVEAREAAVERLPKYRSVVTRIAAPVLSHFLTYRDSRTALLGAARVALALKAYQTDHERYPDSLADLERAGWKLPRDLFSGRAYRFRRDGAGFVVWSVGPDMDDDRGKPKDLKAKSPEAKQDYDIPFRCAR